MVELNFTTLGQWVSFERSKYTHLSSTARWSNRCALGQLQKESRCFIRKFAPKTDFTKQLPQRHWRYAADYWKRSDPIGLWEAIQESLIIDLYVFGRLSVSLATALSNKFISFASSLSHSYWSSLPARGQVLTRVQQPSRTAGFHKSNKKSAIVKSLWLLCISNYRTTMADVHSYEIYLNIYDFAKGNRML